MVIDSQKKVVSECCKVDGDGVQELRCLLHGNKEVVRSRLQLLWEQCVVVGLSARHGVAASLCAWWLLRDRSCETERRASLEKCLETEVFLSFGCAGRWLEVRIYSLHSLLGL